MKLSRETKILPYILLCILFFYIFPLILPNQFGFLSYPLIKTIILAVINSLLVFFGSYLCALICGFIWYLPFLSGLLFAPSMFLYYEPSCWIYILIYFLFSFLGCFLGSGMRKERIKNKELKQSLKADKKENNQASLASESSNQ